LAACNLQIKNNQRRILTLKNFRGVMAKAKNNVHRLASTGNILLYFYKNDVLPLAAIFRYN
jgi:hypothetical protein